MSVIKMTDLDLAGKCVLVRTDLNIPVKEGKVTSDAHIHASLPTTELAPKQGVKIVVTPHLGRPTEGEYNEEFSPLPAVNYLKNKLSAPVRLVKNYLDDVEVATDEPVALENTRSNEGEKRNDEALSKKYAAPCDVFVMDTFDIARRAQTFTHGMSKFAGVACVGPLLAAELDALSKALKGSTRLMVTIIDGSEVSTKPTVLSSLLKITDQLIAGGGTMNTFVAAQGRNMGKSLYGANLVDEAKRLLITCDVLVPTDIRIATEFSETMPAALKSVSNVRGDEQTLGIGSAPAQQLADALKNVETTPWNGPADMLEFPSFRRGTEIAASATVDSEAFFIAGGGDTLTVIDLFGIIDKISYIPTGDGAFLEFVEGKVLPAVAMFKERAKKQAFSGQGNLPNYQRALERAPFPRLKIQDS